MDEVSQQFHFESTHFIGTNLVVERN